MANGYEGMNRFCENLKRLGQLEKLMARDLDASSPIVQRYQAKHNLLVMNINNYISQNYSGDSLDFALDFYHHMVGEKEDAVEEVHAAYARREEKGKKSAEDLKKIIEDFTAKLAKMNERLN